MRGKKWTIFISIISVSSFGLKSAWIQNANSVHILLPSILFNSWYAGKIKEKNIEIFGDNKLLN